MFAVVDCGTTNTRIYIIDNQNRIIVQGERKVGTKDTAIAGTVDVLRNGLTDLYNHILKENGISAEMIQFAIASGMITSEIGLVELPHLTAPVGINELAEGIVKYEDGELLSLGCPIYFVRGVKNKAVSEFSVQSMQEIDFMRGEEVQCIGFLSKKKQDGPCNIVVLSSHTKNIYINAEKKITASCTTMSGQLYEALLSGTFLGSSVVFRKDEERRYSTEEIIDIAVQCADNGIGRAFLMPRFMQVLMKTHSNERNIFIDAVIAADDLKTFRNMRQRGLDSGRYFLIGKKERCEMYEYMIKRYLDEKITVEAISSPDEIAALTVAGSVAVGNRYMCINGGEEQCLK